MDQQRDISERPCVFKKDEINYQINLRCKKPRQSAVNDNISKLLLLLLVFTSYICMFAIFPEGARLIAVCKLTLHI